MQLTAGEIKRLLLFDDHRGIASAVLRHRDPREAGRVARSLANLPPATAMIATGFLVNGKPETDGPPGALFLGAALATLGWRVVYVSGDACLRLLRDAAWFDASYSPFPVESEASSRKRAGRLLGRHQPRALFFIEVCGRTADGHYRNMRGLDIGAFTPRLDLLALATAAGGVFSVGIGDGGNEVGFGCVSAKQLARCGITPCRVRTDALLAASVSNWAAYVLILLLGLETGKVRPPSFQAEERVLKRLAAGGAVDGFSGLPGRRVDGRTLRTRAAFLRQLRGWTPRRAQSNSVTT
jgi:hypothetical protein